MTLSEWAKEAYFNDLIDHLYFDAFMGRIIKAGQEDLPIPVTLVGIDEYLIAEAEESVTDDRPLSLA